MLPANNIPGVRIRLLLDVMATSFLATVALVSIPFSRRGLATTRGPMLRQLSAIGPGTLVGTGLLCLNGVAARMQWSVEMLGVGALGSVIVTVFILSINYILAGPSSKGRTLTRVITVVAVIVIVDQMNRPCNMWDGQMKVLEYQG